MSTITRERAELKSFITGFLSDPAHDNQSSRSMTAEVFRIALASLEADESGRNPVGLFAKRNGTWLELCQGDTFEHPDCVPLYIDPPVQEATGSTGGVKEHFLAGYDAGHSRGFTCGRLYGEDGQVRAHRVAAAETYLTEIELAE